LEVADYGIKEHPSLPHKHNICLCGLQLLVVMPNYAYLMNKKVARATFLKIAFIAIQAGKILKKLPVTLSVTVG
jgi:hypothetical protein